MGGSVRNKFVLIVVLGVCVFALLYSLALFEQRKGLREAYLSRSHSIVSMAVSLVRQFERRQQSGELSESQAQQQAKAVLRGLRYDGASYVFVVDTKGRFLVNPMRPDLEGQDVTQVAELRDVGLMELLDQAVSKGEAEVEYNFRAVEGGKPRDKVSFVQFYPSWGWLVGSGTYVEDAEARFIDSAWQFSLMVVPVGAMLIYVIFLLSRSVAVPLSDLSRTVAAIRARQDDVCVPHTGRDDEVGELARAVEALRHVEVMEQEVRRSHDLVAKVFDASHDAVLITDHNGIIVQANAIICRISGYELPQLLGRNVSVLASGHHDKAFFGELWRTLQQEGGWEGEIWNRRANGELLITYQRISALQDVDGHLSHFIAFIDDWNERPRLRGSGRRQVRRDPLTNLADRSLYAMQLSQSLSVLARTGQPFGLLLIDVDGFARVNELVGARNGDEVLRHLALRLLKELPGGNVLARLGSDDFAVLAPGIGGISEMEMLAQAMMGCLDESVEIEGRRLGLSVSIALVLAPYDGCDETTLMRVAQTRLRQAQDQGGARIVGPAPATLKAAGAGVITR